MADFTQYRDYTTRENQRWDTVAWEAYGNPYQYEMIVFANPEFRTYAQLPPGVVLKVPILEQATAVIEPDLLPPWKR